MSVKILHAANNVRSLFILVVVSLVTAALLFALIEQVSVLDGFYWASTTMSTVGYGDISAHTAAGKVFTILFQQFSTFVLLPLAVWNVINKFDTSAFTHREQEWQENSIKKIAERLNIELDESPSDYDC